MFMSEYLYLKNKQKVYKICKFQIIQTPLKSKSSTKPSLF